jgi:hypothetical protein
MAGKLNDPAGGKEKAEGERETVDQALKNAERKDQQQPGITNKPLAEEEQQQRELPPRGHAKSEEA